MWALLMALSVYLMLNLGAGVDWSPPNSERASGYVIVTGAMNIQFSLASTSTMIGLSLGVALDPVHQPSVIEVTTVESGHQS
ncbi:hypothetical protein M758_10G162800 [Ceratodon purpureus]|nr:hypothetical protein M758_10G162800 [Ceratodon purpureus]